MVTAFTSRPRALGRFAIVAKSTSSEGQRAIVSTRRSLQGSCNRLPIRHSRLGWHGHSIASSNRYAAIATQQLQRSNTTQEITEE